MKYEINIKGKTIKQVKKTKSVGLWPDGIS